MSELDKLDKEQIDPIVRIEDITEKDIAIFDTKDGYEGWNESIHPQIYYILKKLKELEERILKLENPKVVATR